MIITITDEPPTLELIVSHVNDCLAPAIWNNYLENEDAVTRGYGNTANLPKLLGDGSDDIWEVETWDKALQKPEDAFAIADDMDGECFQWIREDKGHLYSLFQVGFVPVNEYKRRRLPPGMLQGKDKDAYDTAE